MIATPHPQSPANEEATPTNTLAHASLIAHSLPATLLPRSHISHHPASGLNPLVDSASAIFSLLGKIKQTSYHHLLALQQEILHEIHVFEDHVQHRGYHPDYIVVCRYLLCATFDDVIAHSAWGATEWENYSLLIVFNQDTHHQEKFFAMMERALKDPQQYIDLLEVMYLCLSFGYKGPYRGTEHNQYQLEQITNTLYQHIRHFRGSFCKFLSPAPLKPFKNMVKRKKLINKSLPIFVFLITASIIMIIFISLSYLMDTISNEVTKDIFPVEGASAISKQ